MIGLRGHHQLLPRLGLRLPRRVRIERPTAQAPSEPTPRPPRSVAAASADRRSSSTRRCRRRTSAFPRTRTLRVMSRGLGAAARGLAIVASVSLLLSGCLLRPPDLPAGRQQAPTRGQLGARAAPSAAARPRRSRDGRPVAPVPADVKPEGFTDPPPGSGLERYLQQKLDVVRLRRRACSAPRRRCRWTTPTPTARPSPWPLSRKPATAGPRLGSLFINPGGPGGSGVEYVGLLRDQGPGAVRHRRLGSSRRGPVDAGDLLRHRPSWTATWPADSSPDSAAEDDELLEAEQEFGRSCLDRSGRLLEHVSTAETVRDLDVLRALVGDDKLNYFGSSYGTQIGALYAELFPKLVGRLVLDGAVNITDDKSVSQTLGFERALGSFAAWCAEQEVPARQTKAAGAGSDQRASGADLDAKPLKGGRRPLTQQLGVTGVLFVLYENERGWKYLQQALELAIFDRDPRFLLFLADQYHQREREDGHASVRSTSASRRCDASTPRTPTSTRRARGLEPTRPRRRSSVRSADRTTPARCGRWLRSRSRTRSPAKGAAPILVIGTTGDPATPYEYAERMAKQLTSGRAGDVRGRGPPGVRSERLRAAYRPGLSGARPGAGRRRALLMPEPKSMGVAVGSAAWRCAASLGADAELARGLRRPAAGRLPGA